MWNNLKKMFPTGKVPYYEINPEELNDGNCIEVRYKTKRMARNMTIEEMNEVFTEDGDHFVETSYSIYPKTQIIDGLHCLNVFGQKMINEKKEQCSENDRFNYTGI